MKLIFGVLLMSLMVFYTIAQSADLAPIYIDVRTEQEYQQGHIEQAYHIPYQEIAARIGEVTDNHQQPIIVYCRSGRRSGIAKQLLEQAGFEQVTNGGGYMQLQQSLQAP